MEIRYTPDNIRYQRMNTKELREAFLLDQLFIAGELSIVYSDVDRAIIGGIVPTSRELKLEGGKEIAADYFAQRREIGVINIGSPGTVAVDGNVYQMDKLDGLYIGKGSKDISFQSQNPEDPAYFYLLSYPSHSNYQTSFVKRGDAEIQHLGAGKEANERTIYKYIHPGGVRSSQLVMGLTKLTEGSVWNTMPPHTHERRTEVYLYFDVDEKSVVFHLMGKPDETRHIAVRNRQAVMSPSWSIHSAAGTSNYIFIWGMGGENQEFGDMDHIKTEQIY